MAFGGAKFKKFGAQIWRTNLAHGKFCFLVARSKEAKFSTICALDASFAQTSIYKVYKVATKITITQNNDTNF